MSVEHLATPASIKKQATEFFVWTFLGMILAKLRGVVFVKLFSSFLGPATYGSFYFLLNNSTVLASLIGFNMGVAVFRFTTEEDALQDPIQSNLTLLSSICLLLVFSGFSSLLMFSSAFIGIVLFQSETYVLDISLMSLLAPVIAFDNILLAFFRSRQNKIKYFSLQAVIPYLTLIGSVIFGILLQLSVLGMMIAHIGGYLILIIPLLLELITKRSGKLFTFSRAKEIINFSYPSMLVTVIESTKTFILNLLLLGLYGNETVGIYSVAISIVNIFAVLDYVVNLSYPTIIIKNYEIGNHDYIQRFVNKMTRIYLVVIIAVTLFLCTFVPSLVLVFSSPEFWESTALIPVLFIGFVFQALVRLTGFGPLVKKRPGLAGIRNAFASLVFLLSVLVLVPGGGALGAVWSRTVFFISLFLLDFHLSQSLYPIKYDIRKFITIAGITAASLVIGFLFPVIDSPLVYSSFGVAFAVFMVLVIGFRIIKSREVVSILKTLMESVPTPKRLTNRLYESSE
ncbi:MAG: lipopolysaccharide biosynthesis protein [Candidatus Heimdallarchaeota archaeon]